MFESVEDISQSSSFLVLRLQRGDYEAYERLYDMYSQQTLQRIRRLVFIKEEAEEIFQDVFLKIWEGRADLPADVPFEAIVSRKAKSLVYNFYRKTNQNKALYEKLIASATVLYDELEDQLSFKETDAALMNAIARLPEQRQRIFRYIKIEGKSYDEAAQEFGISLSTVKDHMSRALRFIRSELIDKYPFLLFAILIETLFK